MWFQFFRAGKSSSKKVLIKSSKALESALDQLVDRKGAASLFFDEIGPHLLIAVTDNLGYASHDPSSTKSPYWQLRSRRLGRKETVTLNVGNTTTEVSRQNCVRIEYLKQIAHFFFETGQLLEGPEWFWEPDRG